MQIKDEFKKSDHIVVYDNETNENLAHGYILEKNVDGDSTKFRIKTNHDGIWIVKKNRLRHAMHGNHMVKGWGKTGTS